MTKRRPIMQGHIIKRNRDPYTIALNIITNVTLASDIMANTSHLAIHKMKGQTKQIQRIMSIKISKN